MKIQIWSDIMCPFCYLGEKNLKNAIEEYKGKDKIEVEFKAFQLNPAQENTLNPINPRTYSIKKGMNTDVVNNSIRYIVDEATKLNLPIDIENAKVVNSLDALRLVKFAAENGKSLAIVDDLFKAYFAERIDLSDHDNLIKIAEKNGFDKHRIEEFLNSDQLIDEVNSDRNEGISKGLQGVPFFVIDDQYVLSGNQPKDNFINAFNQIESTSDGKSCNLDSTNC